MELRPATRLINRTGSPLHLCYQGPLPSAAAATLAMAVAYGRIANDLLSAASLHRSTLLLHLRAAEVSFSALPWVPRICLWPLPLRVLAPVFSLCVAVCTLRSHMSVCCVYGSSVSMHGVSCVCATVRVQESGTGVRKRGGEEAWRELKGEREGVRCSSLPAPGLLCCCKV